jgi:hypothetical protein
MMVAVYIRTTGMRKHQVQQELKQDITRRLQFGACDPPNCTPKQPNSQRAGHSS